MDEVGDGSMDFSPFVEPLPMTADADGSVSVDLSDLENPDMNISASVNFVVEYCRRKNKELRVKVPREYFSLIAPLKQMGFDKIELATTTYIILSGDILQVASDVTRKQRATIASSSNPSNLNNNQTPGDAPLVVVQTPSQTACASDWNLVAAGSPEFQHSNRAFPMVEAGMENGYGASRLKGFSVSVGPEIPECGVQTKNRVHPANEPDGLPSKRSRDCDITDKEKGLFLRSKLEFLQDPANTRQFHTWLVSVTEKLKYHGLIRKPTTWRGLWETLVKNFDSLRKSFPQYTGYWDLTEVDKRAIKQKDSHFPLTFEPGWVVAMENIWKIKPRRPRREREEDRAVTQSLASTVVTGSANFAGAGSSDANFQASMQQPLQTSAQGSDEGLQVENHQPPRGTLLRDVIQNFASSSHIWREEDSQQISATVEEQLAMQRELIVSVSESRSSDSLGVFDYDGCSAQKFY